MRRLALVWLLLILVSCGKEINKKGSSVSNTEPAEAEKGIPVLTFSKTSCDFGKIAEGEVVGTSFTFTNTGNSDLIILDASASCGCTVPKWSREPVRPGGQGSLEVIFDSSGREGKQHKSVTVKCNASDQNYVLLITADVESGK